MSRRSRLLPDERSSLLELRRRHGMTFAELAEMTGVRAGTLHVWARRERAARSVPRFIEVEPSGAGTDPVVLEVEVAGGRRVRVPPGFDAAELRRLLEAIEAPC